MVGLEVPIGQCGAALPEFNRKPSISWAWHAITLPTNARLNVVDFLMMLDTEVLQLGAKEKTTEEQTHQQKFHRIVP